MENASKALLMAAGVLIGLMIITLGVFLYANFGGTSKQIHDQIETNQINNFNSQFTQYDGKRVTIYDVVSMANLAKQNNDQYGFNISDWKNDGKNNYIAIIFKNKNYESFDTNRYNDDIKDELNSITATTELPTYLTKVSISDATRRVYKVEFTN